jgi:hypothetical protein
MNKKKMEKILGKTYDNFGEIKFSNINKYHYYIEKDKELEINNDKIYLDGDFSYEELEAIAFWLKNKIKEEKNK